MWWQGFPINLTHHQTHKLLCFVFEIVPPSRTAIKQDKKCKRVTASTHDYMAMRLFPLKFLFFKGLFEFLGTWTLARLDMVLNVLNHRSYYVRLSCGFEMTVELFQLGGKESCTVYVHKIIIHNKKERKHTKYIKPPKELIISREVL